MVLFPNAKINIGLFITEKRPDGFHNIETIFYPIGLCDILELHKEESGAGECIFHTSGIPIDCEPEKNLVIKAYRLLAKEFDLPSVRVHLHKIIPFGAGLGGGSADAAYMLKGLNELFVLGLSDSRLEDYAVRLGSDCAFFIRNRPVYARGKGEMMSSIDLDLNDYYLVLVKPDGGVATPEAYAGITPCAATFDLREVPCCPVADWKERVRNDFENTVNKKLPEINRIKERLDEAGALYVSMTGSGSAVYALFERKVEVKEYFPDYFTWQSE
ncbi:4-(cytidine 5'-diphospho)-2-C-methyl-D-erythritol kinase [Sanguibacteroides justesenii]|uniref:4-diphosphocytidyl-2-C-methyl-D-erythritol kinase n=1 Tax=Sanguibacteroides justesenii TaxID=1547597 RepID=A0A0C3NHX3_9PORP|nr:4-(cytidine 5'-diphospho)-2-C-methyl-D-erythritol kinase [Sanguibacteroides justesenii]KIO43568.1 4-diphosphocytidyl-2C-methyl-D-erythritol kinase [Sanguibacteroides justesenii]KIO45732.1 4-diphosphocytidyl-2C-methyl-D-erythritol kinase [Sanguibacteroides justesenii]